MQLDPGAPLSPQLIAVSSTALEQLTAATCASVGYTVFRGLRYEIGGEGAAEVDVFASVFTPWRESRVLFECKGGVPSFNDIRKFASLRHLLEPTPDDLIVIAQQGCPVTRQELAQLLGARVVEKTNLTYYVLPLLGGATLRKERAIELNRYLAWQSVHDYLVGKTNSHPTLKQHYRLLLTQLWRVGDPSQQIALSFDAYKNQFPNTSDEVATARGLSAVQAAYDAPNDDIEAAFYVVLLHRLMNAYSVVRYTLFVMQHKDSAHLATMHGSSMAETVSALSAHPRFIYGFPSFLQTFFFVWGGFIYAPRRDEEISRMAQECRTSPEAVEQYLLVLEQLFTGAGTSMFQTWTDFWFFKWVPAAFRALGAEHRKALNPTAYSGVQFFGTSHPKHADALNRALTAIGGTASLRFVA